MRKTSIALQLSERSYRVLGSTAEDLATGIAMLGPRIGGRSFAAASSWELTWSHSARALPEGFTVLDATITLRASCTLPAWAAPPHASEATVQRFRLYQAKLRAHERGHIALALTAGRSLRRLIDGLGVAPSVAQLAWRIDQLGAQVVARCRADERDYDRTTEHGRTHGVLWPTTTLEAS